jgi:hypothetical protein
MFICCVCCQVEVSAMSWSLVQRSPTDCGTSLCVIKKPRERGHSPRWTAEPEKIIVTIIICIYLCIPRGRWARSWPSPPECRDEEWVSCMFASRYPGMA